MIAHQLEQNTMWVYKGYGHWQECPVDSKDALTYQKALDGMIPEHRQRREREFLAWKQKRDRLYAEREMLSERLVKLQKPAVNLHTVLSDEYRDYVLFAEGREENIQPEFVTLDKIIPTQAEVNQELVDWYTRSGYSYDENGKPPFAVRFYGDEQVYLTNGHHRYARNLARANGGHYMMYLHVDSIDLSFDEACGKLEPFPVDVINLFELMLEAA